ncbi:MAG TPA: hypothetical protein VHL79_05625 [Ramlibacter sp.]|nr:hypothetical protein [Ramlibacter sp.]
MHRLFSTKPLLAAAVAVAALAAGTAHARSDVYFSIGIQPSYGYVQPAPVYVQPAPVYTYPSGVYYYQEPRVSRRGPWGDADRDGIPNRYDRYDNSRRGGYGDRDRDGVPNRFDRAPHNPYRY